MPHAVIEAESLPAAGCVGVLCNVSWRQLAVSDARSFVSSLTLIIALERENCGREPVDGLLRRIRCAAARLDFDSPEGDFVLFHLIAAAPWSERVASPGMRLVRLLGLAFDLPGIFHRYERPISDAWCYWSLRWVWSLSRVWHDACAD